MKTLRSRHAEDVGGFIVEPGKSFDETAADPNVVNRLQEEGKLADAGKPKSSTKKGDE